MAVENVPFPLRSFEGARYAQPPDDYLDFFRRRDRSVILNLPSGTGYGLAGSADDLNVFNRELIYINWQTYHGHDIANGVNGYIPHSRIATQLLIYELPSWEAIDELAALGIDFIAFNKGLVLPGEAPVEGNHAPPEPPAVRSLALDHSEEKIARNANRGVALANHEQVGGRAKLQLEVRVAKELLGY